MRFAASLALTGWQKALPEDDVRRLVARYVRAYLPQINHYRGPTTTTTSRSTSRTPTGRCSRRWRARLIRRADLLDGLTRVDDGVRCSARTRPCAGSRRRSGEGPTGRSRATWRRSPRTSASTATSSTTCATSSGKTGFGIGSAGLPAYNVLVEGYSQALDNDVVLSMKQANVPAVSRFVDTGEVDAYFDHEGQRTVVSQRALQAHTDPLLGWTTVDGVGYVVSEVSPYEVDLEWGGITEPEEIAEVVDQLGRATAKIHCASDEDSNQDLVDFQVEEAIASCLDGRRKALTEHLVEFGIAYAVQVREDHTLFVEAFRQGADRDQRDLDPRDDARQQVAHPGGGGPARLQHLGVVERLAGDAGGEVGDQARCRAPPSGLAGGDRLERRAHADQVAADPAHHLDLGRGLVVRARGTARRRPRRGSGRPRGTAPRSRAE